MSEARWHVFSGRRWRGIALVVGLLAIGAFGAWRMWRGVGPAGSRVWVEALGLHARYVDERTCHRCHQDQAATYLHSAHALTSSVPSPASMKGDFSPGANLMRTSDAALTFLLEAGVDGYFQTARRASATGSESTRRERIDIVIGSGRKGQTFLFWQDDQLFELPVSCWSATREWMNSPGFPDGTAHFDRGASSRCLECHATSFVSRPPPRNRFDPRSLVLGISCQKCHGPGSAHVAHFSSDPPAAASAKTTIVNPGKLTRERQMDLCALCHAGVGQPVAPPLSYVPGDDLAKSIVIAPPPPDADLDVHGSQVQSLIQSRCFAMSGTMTCTTCHDVHADNRRPDDYAKNCQSCHRVESCGKFGSLGVAIVTRCVDCHMPMKKTDKIIMRINGRNLQPEVRSHRIGIHPSDP